MSDNFQLRFKKHFLVIRCGSFSFDVGVNVIIGWVCCYNFFFQIYISTKVSHDDITEILVYNSRDLFRQQILLPEEINVSVEHSSKSQKKIQLPLVNGLSLSCVPHNG